MPDAVLVQIADAVVAELNAASLSQTFTAERAYVPVHELTAAAGLKVTVVPEGYSVSPVDLARHAFDCHVEVTVQQRADPPTNGAVDPLLLLAQEVIDLFLGRRLESFPAARCIGVTRQPAYDRNDLETLRTFAAVVPLVFRVTR